MFSQDSAVIVIIDVIGKLKSLKKQEAVAIYLAAASLFVRPSCFSDLVMWVLDSCSREWA